MSDYIATTQVTIAFVAGGTATATVYANINMAWYTEPYGKERLRWYSFPRSEPDEVHKWLCELTAKDLDYFRHE